MRLAYADSPRASHGLPVAAIPRTAPILCMRCLCFPHFSFSISRPLTQPLPKPPTLSGCLATIAPCRWSLGARAGAPRVVLGRAKGTHERSRMLVVLACRRSLPTPTLTARIDRLSPPISYVANVCSKCFGCSRAMLRLFHMDVAK